MRVTTMSRMAKGVRTEGYPELSADLEEVLEHLKWNLWHGRVLPALEIVDELAYALEVEGASPEHRKLLKAVRWGAALNAGFLNHWGLQLQTQVLGRGSVGGQAPQVNGQAPGRRHRQPAFAPTAGAAA
jgi:hypothetical protein